MPIAPVGTLERLRAHRHLTRLDLLQIDPSILEVRDEAERETACTIELSEGLSLRQVCLKLSGQKIYFLRNLETHPHGRHVALRVVDPSGRLHARIVDVEGDGVRLDDAPQHGVAEQRLIDHDARLLQLLDRIRAPDVQHVPALSVVLDEVLLEILWSEEVIEARELPNFVVRERLADLLPELDLAHSLVLLIRHGQKGDGLAKALTQVVVRSPKVRPERRRLPLPSEDPLEELVHGQAVLDLEDLAPQELAHLGHSHLRSLLEERLRESDHVDLDREVHRRGVRSHGVLVVGLVLAVGRDERSEGPIVLHEQLTERVDHGHRIDGPVVRQHVKRSDARLDVLLLNRTQFRSVHRISPSVVAVGCLLGLLLPLVRFLLTRAPSSFTQKCSMQNDKKIHRLRGGEFGFVITN